MVISVLLYKLGQIFQKHAKLGIVETKSLHCIRRRSDNHAISTIKFKVKKKTNLDLFYDFGFDFMDLIITVFKVKCVLSRGP